MKSSRALLFIFPLLLLSCKTINVFSPKWGNDAETVKVIETKFPYQSAQFKHIDLVHVDLEVEPLWASKTMKGSATLLLTPYYFSTDSIVLDAKFMDILSVKVDSHYLDANFRNREGNHFQLDYDSLKLKIYLNETLLKGDTVEVQINYVAHPERIKNKRGEAIKDAKGLYFIERKEDVYPEHIWTQGETEANSAWFPCIDKPNEKISQRISIKVDTQYVTLSNGTLIHQKIEGNRRIDTWEQKQEHAPYLAMMFIGPYDIIHDEWVRSEGDTISVDYYMERDWSQYARDVFKDTRSIIQFYSDTLDYLFPWDKYAQVVVRDYVSGAMENTTASVFHEGLNITDVELMDKHYNDVISHELFHQWFGDIITCESWSNLPLNESFATYGEYIWYRHRYGRDEADYHLFKDLTYYLSEADVDEKYLVRYHYEDERDMFDRHSYQKGGRVLHMLRDVLGDKAFFDGLKLYLKRYQYKTAEIHDLRLVFEEMTGMDLNWFFDQWFLSKGHPRLEMNTEVLSENKWRLSFKEVKDLDRNFKLKLNLDVHSIDSKTSKSYWINSIKDTIIIESDQKIEWVNLDPNRVLLWECDEHKSIVDWEKEYQQSASGIDRYLALKKLENYQGQYPEVVDEFRQAIQDPFDRIRSYALYNGKFGNHYKEEDFAKELLSLAKEDPSSKVRAASIYLLGKINAVHKHTFVDTVIEHKLEDSSLYVKSGVLYYLSFTNLERAEEIAEEYIYSDHTDLGISIGHVLSKLNRPKRLHVDFYIRKMDESSTALAWNYGYLFIQYVSQHNFQNLEDINHVLDFIIRYQNENYKRSYTNYFVTQMLDTLRMQYNMLLKDQSLSVDTVNSINDNIEKINGILDLFKSR